MATSLLRLGRLGLLKCLQQDGWVSLRTPLTVALCTKADAPKKPSKKASTLEAPDERAALLAYKTTVAFPTRLSTPGFLSQCEQSRDPTSAEPIPSTPQVTAEASAEETVTTVDAKQVKSVANDSPKAETQSCDVEEAAETPPVVETATEKYATSPTSADVEAPKSKVTQKDDSTTSSSSSSSDSDSDSDSDDEEPDKIEMTKPVSHTEDRAGQKEIPSAVSEESVSDIKARDVSERASRGAPEGATRGAPEETSKGTMKESPDVFQAVCEAPSKESPAPYPVTAPTEQVMDPTPALCTAESVNSQVELKPEKEAGVKVTSTDVSEAIPQPITQGAADKSVEPSTGLTHRPATEVASEPEVEIQAASATSQAVAASEELIDPAPVITDADEVRAEPEIVAASEEAAAAPAPKPEPFDNSTYKNLQHHTYNVYTFVDMDVEMAKDRLPQPSTGRPSPQH